MSFSSINHPLLFFPSGESVPVWWVVILQFFSNGFLCQLVCIFLSFFSSSFPLSFSGFQDRLYSFTSPFLSLFPHFLFIILFQLSRPAAKSMWTLYSLAFYRLVWDMFPSLIIQYTVCSCPVQSQHMDGWVSNAFQVIVDVKAMKFLYWKDVEDWTGLKGSKSLQPKDKRVEAL